MDLKKKVLARKVFKTLVFKVPACVGDFGAASTSDQILVEADGIVPEGRIGIPITGTTSRLVQTGRHLYEMGIVTSCPTDVGLEGREFYLTVKR